VGGHVRKVGKRKDHEAALMEKINKNSGGKREAAGREVSGCRAASGRRCGCARSGSVFAEPNLSKG